MGTGGGIREENQTIIEKLWWEINLSDLFKILRISILNRGFLGCLLWSSLMLKFFMQPGLCIQNKSMTAVHRALELPEQVGYQKQPVCNSMNLGEGLFNLFALLLLSLLSARLINLHELTVCLYEATWTQKLSAWGSFRNQFKFDNKWSRNCKRPTSEVIHTYQWLQSSEIYYEKIFYPQFLF